MSAEKYAQPMYPSPGMDGSYVNPGGPQYHPGPHHYQQPVIHQQPAQTTVIVSSAGPAVKNLRGWSTGLCGCMEDPMGCVAAAFCPECYGCHLAGKAGETCCLPMCVPAWLIVLRAHIRGKHNIEGTICDDCCMVSCCYPCAMCQLSREIDNINSGRAAP